MNTFWSVETGNSKTDRLFLTRQEALDYITMNDDTGHWHIEEVSPERCGECGAFKMMLGRCPHIDPLKCPYAWSE